MPFRFRYRPIYVGFKFFILPAVAVAALLSSLNASDWPTYRRDNFRSGRSDDSLAVKQLQLAWDRSAAHPPAPAWHGPARWDAYNDVLRMGAMRNYDAAFQPIVVGGRLFYGSSVDDTLVCLDTKTGEEVWTYTTDGPLRVAPSFSEGRLFFGSDDGYAYCLNSNDGELIWKFRPADDDATLLHNGRVISFWPIRTGLLVDGATVYFGASLLPWKTSYLCAVDAETGKPDGEGRFVRPFPNMTMEGVLLATDTRLVVPQGRVRPQLFNRKDGASLGVLHEEKGEGCYAVITPRQNIVHGPGRRWGEMVASSLKIDDTKPEPIAGYQRGRVIVFGDDVSYFGSDSALAAADKDSEKPIWKVPGAYRSLIMTGTVLIGGGADSVVAYDANTGNRLWETKVDGIARGLVVANGALFVSTDRGRIYCFRPTNSSDQQVTSAIELKPLTKVATAKRGRTSTRYTPVTGPTLQFISTSEAVVRWTSAEPLPTVVEYGYRTMDRRFEDPELTTSHVARLSHLSANREYNYTIVGQKNGKKAGSKKYIADTFFNYNLEDVADRKNPFDEDASWKLCAKAAEHILAATNIDRGIAVIVGSGRGQLAIELARRSRLRIIGVDTNRNRVAAARASLRDAGVYGSRISLLHVDSYDSLPLPGSFANLVVSQHAATSGLLPTNATNIHRLLRPETGVAYLGQPSGAEPRLTRNTLEAWSQVGPQTMSIHDDDGGLWVKIARDGVPGAGQWTHQYGGPGNASFNGETLGGAKSTDEMEVLWIGRPGPRYQPDRSGRKPAPLAAAGRLFAQGLERIVALDHYNGTILWSREITGMMRMNVPRDCGNWCADHDFVYVAVDKHCWQLDAATGKIATMHAVQLPAEDAHDAEWGYVGRVGDRLLGSSTKSGSSYRGFWGHNNWHENSNAKVCSDNLFALKSNSGEAAWNYANGVIINSTICAGDDHVHFVESRNPALKKRKSRMIDGAAGLWKQQYLVTLDVQTGEKLWEEPLTVEQGEAAYYLALSNNTLVLVASKTPTFHIYTFAADSGEPLWKQEETWATGQMDHGTHLSIPAIVGDTLYVRPGVFDLTSGLRKEISLPRGGCGTYVCTAHAIFQRMGSTSMWDSTSGNVTKWTRLRPGCWLSTIPAGGMVLSPEAGGGCSCGTWLETSIGFITRE